MMKSHFLSYFAYILSNSGRQIYTGSVLRHLRQKNIATRSKEAVVDGTLSVAHEIFFHRDVDLGHYGKAV